jgi:hypothetical protein
MKSAVASFLSTCIPVDILDTEGEQHIFHHFPIWWAHDHWFNGKAIFSKLDLKWEDYLSEENCIVAP